MGDGSGYDPRGTTTQVSGLNSAQALSATGPTSPNQTGENQDKHIFYKDVAIIRYESEANLQRGTLEDQF